MDLRLTGKRALVTGGSRGIGKAVARALAREGCDVAICARDARVLGQAADAVGAETGRKVVPIAADTSRLDEVERLVADTVAALGGLDILVNNAAAVGGRVKDSLLEGDEATIREDFDTKVLGYVRTARRAAPHMIESGWGRIVQISGLATRLGMSVSGGMRNAAVTNLGVTLANELGPHGITVNTLQPGAVATEAFQGRMRAMAEQEGVDAAVVEERFAAQSPIRRIVTPEDVAEVVVFLASPLAAGVNGESIAVSGGSPNVYY